jgi:hypothetical protein
MYVGLGLGFQSLDGVSDWDVHRFELGLAYAPERQYAAGSRRGQ